jgi:membrane fusion protein (multidrug efflux system)
VAVVAGLLVLALAGAWWIYSRHFETTDDAYVKSDNVVIAPKVHGYVVAVDANENALVHGGDTIVRLEDDDYSAARDQARAAMAAAEAQVAVLSHQRTLQLAIVEQARAGIRGAQAKAHDDGAQHERDKQLIAKAYVTKEQMDKDAAAAAASDAELARANATLAAAESQLAVVEAQQQQTAAALTQAQARLAEAEIDVKHTVINAPLTGYLGNRSVQVGDYVNPGTQLFTLVPQSGLYVVANFKETQLRRMHVGQVVEMTADVNPGVALRGMIESLSPATGSEFSLLPPQNATGNFTKIVQRLPVRIEFTADSDAPDYIRSGLSMVVTVDIRR